MTSPPARSTAGTVLPARLVAGLGLLAAAAETGSIGVGLSRPGQVSWSGGVAAAVAGSCAVLLAVAAVLVTSTLRGTRRVYGWLLGASLAAFGVATLVRLTVALSCSGAAGCSAAGARVQLQRGSAAFVTVGALVGCVVLIRLRASRPPRGEVSGEASLAVAVTVLAALQAGSYLAGLPAGTDWVRRAQVVAITAWLVLAGFLLARLTGGPAWRAGAEPGGTTVRTSATAPLPGAAVEPWPVPSPRPRGRPAGPDPGAGRTSLGSRDDRTAPPLPAGDGAVPRADAAAARLRAAVPPAGRRPVVVARGDGPPVRGHRDP